MPDTLASRTDVQALARAIMMSRFVAVAYLNSVRDDTGITDEQKQARDDFTTRLNVLARTPVRDSMAEEIRALILFEQAKSPPECFDQELARIAIRRLADFFPKFPKTA